MWQKECILLVVIRLSMHSIILHFLKLSEPLFSYIRRAECVELQACDLNVTDQRRIGQIIKTCGDEKSHFKIQFNYRFLSLGETLPWKYYHLYAVEHVRKKHPCIVEYNIVVNFDLANKDCCETPCVQFSSFLAELTSAGNIWRRWRKAKHVPWGISYFPFWSQTVNLIGAVDVVTFWPSKH